jgi:ech hydrogenase subunit E
MANRTVIPFGPQHPVLPEPVHLDLVLEDETVVEAVPQIGFVHRGLEKLVEKRDYLRFVTVAERVCGICSFGHSLGYSSAIESLMDIEVPARAVYLRGIWHELSRIHSHLLWLGLAADAMGFESLFMHSWRLREKILEVFEKTAGGRVILSVCTPGGVFKDIENTELKAICGVLAGLREEYDQIAATFLEDSSVKNRLVGVGVLSADMAREYGCVGPFARASGLPVDVRLAGEGAYGELVDFAPVTATEGDCYARCKVRVQEVRQSIDIINELVARIPAGEVRTEVKGNPAEGTEAIFRVEQPRGEAFYYVRGNGTKYLERFRVRTPTSANIPGMVGAIAGCDLADVPNIILTIDPCISCSER